MMLAVQFDEQIYDVDVPDELIKDAEEFYKKMDLDMDQGWQISRQWVENPDQQQRCQVVAEKILNAFHQEDQKMILLMSGYILSRIPEVKQIIIDETGDITQTLFY
ncbi:MAG: hypothetical protein OEX19_05215 [Gammaproteobacteria bacterium]|nr:hypothetical protein [Gammaproteobacteria bacterium]